MYVSVHFHSTGVMKSVQWGATGRTVRVCVTALMGHAAITSMVAACVNQASGDPSALRGCALMEPSACTVNRAVSVTANTLSGEDWCSFPYFIDSVFLPLKNIFNNNTNIQI